MIFKFITMLTIIGSVVALPKLASQNSDPCLHIEQSCSHGGLQSGESVCCSSNTVVTCDPFGNTFQTVCKGTNLCVFKKAKSALCVKPGTNK